MRGVARIAIKKIKPAEHLVPSVKKRGYYTSLIITGPQSPQEPRFCAGTLCGRRHRPEHRWMFPPQPRICGQRGPYPQMRRDHSLERVSSPRRAGAPSGTSSTALHPQERSLSGSFWTHRAELQLDVHLSGHPVVPDRLSGTPHWRLHEGSL